MVGRLVKEQHVRLAEQQSAKCHTAALATGKGGDLGVRRRTIQSVHRPFELGVYLPAAEMLDLLGQLALTLYESVHLVVVHRLHELEGDLVIFIEDIHDLLDPFLHDLDDRLVGIHLRLLLKVANRIARRPDHLATVGFLHACDDLHQGRFTGAVQTDDADLGPVEE